MMSVIQRVKQARVEVDGRITGQIGQGLIDGGFKTAAFDHCGF